MYNRHMADAASLHGARLDLVETRGLRALQRAEGQIVIDSLVAWRLAAERTPDRRPLAALVHQVPGGVSGPRLLRSLRRIADLALYRRCDLLIAASDSLAAELVSSGTPSSRIRVVPPGSDLAAPGGAAKDLRQGRRLAVLNVANWTPNKGILELLDAVEPLAEADLRLHLVGSPTMDGRYAHRVAERLQDPGLAGKVVAHGPVAKAEMAAFYAGADVVVLTSRVEGYGTVVAEALSAGVPVVAWESGNMANLFEDGREGFVLAPGDIEGVTAALGGLAGDEDLLTKMRSSAERRGGELPTWEQSARLFYEALDEVDSGLERAAN